MRKGFLAVLAMLWAGAGLVQGQGYHAQPFYPQPHYYHYPPHYRYQVPNYPQPYYPVYHQYAPQSGYGYAYHTTSQPNPWAAPPPAGPVPTQEPPAYGPAASAPDCCGPTCDSLACAPEYVPCCIAPKKVRGPCLWASVEYLCWWLDRAPLSPLVTTSSTPDAPRAGALGEPGTAVLLGDRDLGFPAFSGGRATLGFWFNPDQTCGAEVSAFVLQERTVTFATDSTNGLPPVFIPIFRLGLERAFTIARPTPLGPLEGKLDIDNDAQLWGAEANYFCNLCRKCNCSFDFLAGFRYLDLNENLNLRADLDDPTFDNHQDINESFSTQNRFFGGQLGGRFIWQHGPLGIELLGKIAVGANHQIVQISGITTQTGSGALVVGTFPGGILTQPTNIGTRTHDEISIVPHFQAKVSCVFCKCLRGFVGYDFLYWTRVVRPGDQIDTTVNISQSPAFGVGTLIGAARPMPLFNSTEFFAQGVNCGLEFRY